MSAPKIPEGAQYVSPKGVYVKVAHNTAYKWVDERWCELSMAPAAAIGICQPIATPRPPHAAPEVRPMPSDERGISAAAASAPRPKEDPREAAFLDALESLIEFTAEDAIKAGQPLPGGRGCYGPDVATAERLHAAVLAAARAMRDPAPEPKTPASSAPCGLGVTWRDRRWA